MTRTWIAGGLVLLLAACSGIKLAYNQLDWYVPRLLADYVTLEPAQARLLDHHMAELRQWHCGTQLSVYAVRLRTIHADFENGHISAARATAHHDRIRAFWKSLMHQAAPRVAELVATASAEQIEELLMNFQKKNDEFRAQHVDRSEPARRRDAEKMMRQQLERWLGFLTVEQHQAIRAWREEYTLIGAERLALRLRWQAALRQALEERHDIERLTTRLEILLVEPEQLWTDAYRQKYERARGQIFALLVEISGMLESEQREHLAQRADSWAEDFDQLACAAPPIQTTSADSAQIGIQ